MKTVELKKGVYWVGAIDWNVRDFHGYSTPFGTTYNAYLIVDEKIVLVDTVKAQFFSEMLGRISEIIDPTKIDYVIANHVEVDHSGSLPAIVEKIGNPTVVTSERGAKGLEKYYQRAFQFKTVKTGNTLSLGRRSLAFVEAPMLHWPDSMFTYLKEDHVLMPNDAFGQHIASSKRYEDEVEGGVMRHASKYFANILWPLAPLILKKIDEVVKMGIPIDMIAPSHGLIWRKDPGRIVQAYVDWSQGKARDKIVVIYDTMWGSTDKMARAIAEGITSQGVDVKVLKLRASDQTEAMTEILDAKAVIVGSPTLNNQMFPTIGQFLTYATGLRPKDKLWSFFGSYGWGGGAVRNMMEAVKKTGFQTDEPGLEIKYVPDQEDLKKCFEFGQQIASKIKT